MASVEHTSLPYKVKQTKQMAAQADEQVERGLKVVEKHSVPILIAPVGLRVAPAISGERFLQSASPVATITRPSPALHAPSV